MNAGLLELGQTVAGKYTIERTLGQGGMGVVYVATHRLTGKRLALKCLLPEFVNNADIVGRFMREAQAAGRVQHRNVVDVFDVGRDGDVLFIVMELLEGKPLSELLHDETLTLEEALLILLRAMEGVAEAHAHGIVHRDLKPDNIFVAYGSAGRLDHPKVLDFGISKLDDGLAGSLTQSGVAMGTPYYMCLEQLSGNRDIDQRVDVYAMGVILYEAIAGVPPHVADSISALAIRMMTTEPAPLTELRPDLPQGLAEVIMKAISRHRDQRQGTMQALIDELRPFVPQSAGLWLPEGQSRPLRTPRSGPALRKSRSAAALVATPASQPNAGPAAQSALASQATSASTRGRYLLWAAGGLALSVAGLSAASGALRSTTYPAPPIVATPHDAGPPGVRHTSSPAPTPHVAYADAAAALPTSAESDGGSTSVPVAAPPGSTSRRSKSERSHKAASTSPSTANVATAQPKQAPSPVSDTPGDKAKVRGRAGTLGTDDF